MVTFWGPNFCSSDPAEVGNVRLFFRQITEFRSVALIGKIQFVFKKIFPFISNLDKTA